MVIPRSLHAVGLHSLAACILLSPSPSPAADTARVHEPVGHQADGRIVTPINQTLTPFGKQVDLPGLRPNAMALSPDGRRIIVSGKTSEVLVLDPTSGTILQRVPFPSEKQNEPHPNVSSQKILKPDTKSILSYHGLIYSPDGSRVFLSNVHGSLKVFNVLEDGSLTPSHSIPLPQAKAPRRNEEIPAGLAFSKDSKRLYVCANLSNQLLEIDAASGSLIRAFPVGVAPFDVVIHNEKAYVSNWGGSRPKLGELTGPAGRGTEVKVDPVRHIASEGSVSVIDLHERNPRPPFDIIAGLHASALALSPNGRFLVCANAASDNLTVIDTSKDQVVETIWAKPNPAELFGASPNAIAFSPDGKTLFVANGTQNAVALIHFEPSERESKMLGLVPTGWFPGSIIFDAVRKQVVVANIKGFPAAPGKNSTKVPAFNSRRFEGSISLFPIPDKKELPALSESVARNLRSQAIAQSKLPPKPDAAPRPIPERIGEPSVFKHVLYIIKENRTYDQVLGDDERGKGHPGLCIFGKDITPNIHKLAREFVLLDNTFCSGILSADGHQWSTAAFATDYLERSFAAFPRSYPTGATQDGSDALAYSSAGFLWDNAFLHKKSIRNYGEFCEPKVRWNDPQKKGAPDFAACYAAWKNKSNDVIFNSFPAIASLEAVTKKDTVGWSMEVPDQFRADAFIADLERFEKEGDLPQLSLIALPNDHTSGTRPGSPTPAACVADNDLAFGRIVEAVSKSRFWKDTLILAIEDDPQDGWDHVSGYRTTAFCISAYTKRGAVISTQYNTTSIIRTIEQILGLPPMNQFDASATPMFDCFQDTPDFTPFTATPNLVPLDQMNPPAKSVQNKTLRRNAELSAKMNFTEVDKAPEDALNRILWHAMKGPDAPYPVWAVSDSDDDDNPKSPGFWKRLLRPRKS